MREFIVFIWERFVRRGRNVGYGRCHWCWRVKAIFIDEQMCRSCYFDDYVINYK